MERALNYMRLDDPKVQAEAGNNGIRWNFNPPRAPHRGGLWEAAVKSMKYHLNRVTNGQTLTYEELDTLITKIESVLNSRPLIADATGRKGDLCLTPGHFLIGSQLIAEPLPEPSNLKLVQRFEILNQMMKSFWNCWEKDYLAQLQTGNKWKFPNANITKGAVVILKDDLAPANEWKLGVVQEVYPDADQIIRTIAVKTANSVFRRTVQSVVQLPIQE